MVREFGVEDLDGLVDEGNVGRPVGVADLRGAAVCSLDGEDLLLLILEEEFGRDGNVGCLDAFWLSEAGSNLMFASCSAILQIIIDKSNQNSLNKQ